MTRERPILFSGAMVREILADRKTQTRRIVKPQPFNPECPGVSPVWGSGTRDGEFRVHAAFDVGGERVDRFVSCPYGAPGDRLWVRETSALIWPGDSRPEDERSCRVEYRADGDPDRAPGEWPDDERDDPDAPRWRPSIFMPRWASRLTLEVTSVRLERLQSITFEDAIAEGVTIPIAAVSGNLLVPVSDEAFTRALPKGAFRNGTLTARDIVRAHFASLWDSINGKRASWESNPWIWRVEFRRVHS